MARVDHARAAFTVRCAIYTRIRESDILQIEKQTFVGACTARAQ
jgi:hypothetical protein